MQNIEINIQLDPVEDGISWTPKKVKQEGKYALVIGTNKQVAKELGRREIYAKVCYYFSW